MIGITVICIGKCKEAYLRQACAEYQKRMSILYRLLVEELPACRLSENPSQAEIDAALQKEGKMIIEKIPKGSYVISLCIEGKMMDSRQLADMIAKNAAGGMGPLCFIIGGSFGLSEQVKRISNFRFSMSPMTFPHQLARVMLLEQLYRAAQINAGTKYHK